MILAGTLGAVVGTLPWYGVGRWIGTERLTSWIQRHGHWLGTDAGEIARVDAWFDRYGVWAVVIGRLVPGIRTLISVPAGLSEMSLGRYLLATTIERVERETGTPVQLRSDRGALVGGSLTYHHPGRADDVHHRDGVTVDGVVVGGAV